MELVRYTTKLVNPKVIAESTGTAKSSIHAADGKIRLRVKNARNIYQLELDAVESETMIYFMRQVLKKQKEK